MKKLLVLLILLAACREDDPAPVVYTTPAGPWNFNELKADFHLITVGTKYYIAEGSKFTLQGVEYTTEQTLATVSATEASFILSSNEVKVYFIQYLIKEDYSTMIGLYYSYSINGKFDPIVYGPFTITRKPS